MSVGPASAAPTSRPRFVPLGWWQPNGQPPTTDPAAWRDALADLGRPLVFVQTVDGPALTDGGATLLGTDSPAPDAYPIAAVVPACLPEDLGDRSFCADHGLRYPYVTGAMANGIGSAEIVEAMSRAGMLGFFGAAGLPLPQVEAAVDRIACNLGNAPFGFNLIHTPGEPAIEEGVVDLYLRRGIRLAEASAYLDLTPAVVRYRVTGLRRGPDGSIVAPHRILAKVSRVEVASKFFAPAPDRLLKVLRERGQITEQEAELAKHVPMAQDVTAEADSGGHTDNRPAVCLVPTLLALRDRMQAQHGYDRPLRVGAAGGIATPAAVAAAFTMGAAYVLTGSINQACVESGSSDKVREMLAQAEQADVIMAPAADMFEMGVKVQVLKRGTMFAMRAAKLYELYRSHPSLDAIPAAVRADLEKTIFRTALDDIWAQTRQFFVQRDPSQVPRAEADSKHKMALVFRWYLGQASRWANRGEPTRQVDYQVWCGPAMGAFNEWAKGSFLERPKERRVVAVARNLLYGAAVAQRGQSLRSQGVPCPTDLCATRPLDGDTLGSRLDCARNSA